MRLRGKRGMKWDDLALAREGARVGVFYSMFRCPIGQRKRIVSHYFHSKPAQDFRRASPDLSGAENSGSFPMKIETDETIERKVEIMNGQLETATKKELVEMKSVTDQFNFIFSDAAVIYKISMEHNTEMMDEK